MRITLSFVALFTAAMALPIISENDNNKLETRDLNLALKGPKFSFGKKQNSDDSSSSGMTMPMGKGSSGSSESGGSGSFDVKEAIQGIDSNVNALTEQVKKFNGDSFAALDLMKAAEALLDRIKAGIDGTESAGKIPFKKGLAILPVFSTFVPDTKSAMAALSSKKDLLVKAGVAGIVADKLTQIQEYGQKLDDTIVSQLGTISKPFGKGAYKPVDTALRKGIEDFASYKGQGAAVEGGTTSDDAAAIAAADAAADVADN